MANCSVEGHIWLELSPDGKPECKRANLEVYFLSGKTHRSQVLSLQTHDDGIVYIPPTAGGTTPVKHKNFLVEVTIPTPA